MEQTSYIDQTSEKAFRRRWTTEMYECHFFGVMTRWRRFIQRPPKKRYKKGKKMISKKSKL